MQAKAYPRYKPSGIGWLGDVPAHWSVKRLKYSASINDEALPETTSPDFEFQYVDIGGVSATDGITATERVIFENAPSRARRRVRHGDTIVSTVRTYLRAIAPIKNPPNDLVVSTGFAVVRPRKVEPAFLAYALRETSFVESIVARSVGVSYPACNASEVGGIAIPLPGTTEQQTIAAFLNRETEQLDRFVAKKRGLLERLKERRAALISQTITRGLPSAAARVAGLPENPPLKPSGLVWLGDIPAHWQPVRLKHLLRLRKGAVKTGPFGSQLQSTEMMDGEIKVYNQRSVIDRNFKSGDNYISLAKFEELRAFEVFPNDLLVTTRGTIGRCAVLPEGSERGILHPCLMRVQFDPRRVDNRFAEILIQESGGVLEQLELKSNATTIDVIYSESLREIWFALPPLPEQVAIAKYLDEETAKLDALLGKVVEAVERLQEYRSALITAAVTGKIDVRKETAA
jgi:type I restriction enzyme S subunit